MSEGDNYTYALDYFCFSHETQFQAGEDQA